MPDVDEEPDDEEEPSLEPTEAAPPLL